MLLKWIRNYNNSIHKEIPHTIQGFFSTKAVFVLNSYLAGRFGMQLDDKKLENCQTKVSSRSSYVIICLSKNRIIT